MLLSEHGQWLASEWLLGQLSWLQGQQRGAAWPQSWQALLLGTIAACLLPAVVSPGWVLKLMRWLLQVWLPVLKADCWTVLALLAGGLLCVGAWPGAVVGLSLRGCQPLWELRCHPESSGRQAVFQSHPWSSRDLGLLVLQGLADWPALPCLPSLRMQPAFSLR